MAGLSEVADKIWAIEPNEDKKTRRNEVFNYYFQHFRQIVSDFSARAADENLYDEQVIKYIGFLKENVQICKTCQFQSLAGDGPNPQRALPRLLQDDEDSLSLLARLVFVTGLPISSAAFGDEIRPRWKDSENFTTFMGRVYGKTELPEGVASTKINSSKITASYLEDYAKVMIQWTDCLSEHLVLLRERDRKSILVFRHAGFAHISLNFLKNNYPDDIEMESTLKRGCLPRKLLLEYFMTMKILFPERNDNKSEAILKKETGSGRVDPFLNSLHKHYRRADHENARDALAPANLKLLYEYYPYFGERLQQLWEEADDPSPVTKYERKLDSRRNPRFTYWCSIIALSVAITFGLLSTGLGAVQIWISYCSWLDDPKVAQCYYKKAGNSTAD